MRTSTYPRTLIVWTQGMQVGTWEVSRTGTHTFRYSEEWLHREDAVPLSSSLPIQDLGTPYTGKHVEHVFDNLLPDNPDVRRAIRERYHLMSTSPFDLLSEIGKECIGAIQLLKEGETPHDPQRVEGRELTEREIASILRRAGNNGGFAHEDDDFRISLAGAQEKTALLFHEGVWKTPLGSTATTHLFKLPLGRVGNMNADLSLSLENEWLCSHILRQSGMEVAESELLQFEEVKTLVVERFDRVWKHGALYRVPQEDFCQATGTSPENKYQSDGGPGIETIMEVLRGSSRAHRDREMFFAAQLMFWLLAAPDGHAKNFSVYLERQNQFRLTPLYDIISAYPVLGHGQNQIAEQKLKLAMAVSGKNTRYRWKQITPRHFHETALRCGIDFEPIGLKVLTRMRKALSSGARTLPPDFPESVSEPIFSGLEARLDTLAGFLA